MTYCVAIKTDSGLVFASDSLTNAGIDHVSTYSKMHTFVQPGERMFVLLAAGNLATTQSVVKRLRDDCRLGNQTCLSTVSSISEAVDYVGNVSADVQRTQAARDTANTNFEATFIFGGQIAGQAPEMYMIYTAGQSHSRVERAPLPADRRNQIRQAHPRSRHSRRHAAGAGRALRAGVDQLDHSLQPHRRAAGRIADLHADALDGGRRMLFTEDNPYYRALGDAWNEGLRQALNNLPPFEWENQPQPLQVVASSNNGQMQG